MANMVRLSCVALWRLLALRLSAPPLFSARLILAEATLANLHRESGATWREAGGGLPPGFAVAVAEDEPDRMLYAARNRLYISTNGGVFWSSLPFELPDIESVAWID